MRAFEPGLLLLFSAIGLLAGGLVAVRYLSIHPAWILLALSVFLGTVASVTVQRKRRQALRRFWERACTGIQWRRRFPDSTASQIREFLDIFADAFAFRQRRRSCFSPDDKVMDVYRAVYPDRFMADGLELESLAVGLRQKYGMDLTRFWRDDITLGELFTYTRVA